LKIARPLFPTSDLPAQLYANTMVPADEATALQMLASVAFDAGIINAQFYTTPVLTTVPTSQAAGAWLPFVLGTDAAAVD
jgi:hypothetical protein